MIKTFAALLAAWPPRCRSAAQDLGAAAAERRRRSRPTEEDGPVAARSPTRATWQDLGIAIPAFATDRDAPTPANARRHRRARASSWRRWCSTTCATTACSSRPARTRCRSPRFDADHRARLGHLAGPRRRDAGAGLCPRQRRRAADGRLLPLRRRAAAASWRARAGWCRRPTGAAPRTSAPTWSIRGCRAKARSSTARSPTSPRPGPRTARIKRLAIMDSDGANHRFITNGQATALTPRYSPDYRKIVYLSYLNGNPRIYVYDIGTGRQTLVTAEPATRPSPRAGRPTGAGSSIRWRSPATPTSTASPRSGGQSHAADRQPRASTSAASYSPDGSQIVFESDRSGSQQST